MPSCDVKRLGGLKPTVLLDLIYLMGLLEEQKLLGAQILHPARKKQCSEEDKTESDLHCSLDDDMSYEDRWLAEDERTKMKEQKFEADPFPSPSSNGDITKIMDHQELTSSPNPCQPQIPQTSQTSKVDAFVLELKAIRVSYLLVGALKSLTAVFSCEKLSDLLVVPKSDSPNCFTSPSSSPNTDQAKASSTKSDESAELRSVLQFVVQSMVKWAVRPCPIKQSVSLADLERAQVMIYKGALSGLQEDMGYKG